MLKVNEDLFFQVRSGLQQDIDNKQEMLMNEAKQVVQEHSWDESLIAPLAEMVAKRDDKYNVDKIKAKLDFLDKFVIEVPEPQVEDSAENAEYNG